MGFKRTRNVKGIAKGNEALDDLLASIQADETISDISKQEFRASIKKGRRSANLAKDLFATADEVGKDFAAAIEGGKSIFKARQTQKAFRSVLADKPGRGQSILTR